MGNSGVCINTLQKVLSIHVINKKKTLELKKKQLSYRKGR